MTRWFVKDLSRLTQVTVQTLHHYDRIGLLKPSHRLANGYRVYSEKDLLTLQQIIALKFFGFELSQIKALLTEEALAVQHCNNQAEVLEQKAQALLHGAETLRSILRSIDNNTSIPWETILQLIEVYTMTQQLEHSWVKEIFTPDELKQYAEFEKHMKAAHKEKDFEKDWDDILDTVKKNLKQDPNSAIGIQIGKKQMDWLNSFYGKKYAHLRTKMWEQGFGEGIGLAEADLTPEIMAWLEKAMDAYWKDRFTKILSEVGKAPEARVLQLWNKALDDLYGDEEARKKAVYDKVLQDETVSLEAKAWLRSICSH